MSELLDVGVAFHLFGMDVKWYGIIIATGVLVAVLVACYNAKLKGYSKDLPYELLLWCFPLAIVGARIYYIIFSGQSYTFAEAIAIWNGGIAIYGGIIGGLIGLMLYSIIKKQSLLKVTDIIVPSLIIAQSIGRWGNFANQEVYGKVVTDPALQWFPFSVYIEKLGEWHYATFFYESMICLAGFFLLMFLFKRVKTYGIVTSVYLILYGTERFFLEGMRQESEILFISGTDIPVSQVVSVGFVLAGVILLIVTQILYKKRMQSAALSGGGGAVALKNTSGAAAADCGSTLAKETAAQAAQKQTERGKSECAKTGGCSGKTGGSVPAKASVNKPQDNATRDAKSAENNSTAENDRGQADATSQVNNNQLSQNVQSGKNNLSKQENKSSQPNGNNKKKNNKKRASKMTVSAAKTSEKNSANSADAVKSDVDTPKLAGVVADETKDKNNSDND